MPKTLICKAGFNVFLQSESFIHIRERRDPLVIEEQKTNALPWHQGHHSSSLVYSFGPLAEPLGLVHQIVCGRFTATGRIFPLPQNAGGQIAAAAYRLEIFDHTHTGIVYLGNERFTRRRESGYQEFVICLKRRKFALDPLRKSSRYLPARQILGKRHAILARSRPLKLHDDGGKVP